jgi:hypothetical protein
VRGALASEIREERESFGARRPGLCLGDDLLGRLARRDDAAQPAKRPCGREHHPHRVPTTGHGVTERMHAAFRIGGEPGERCEDDARGSEDDGERARSVYPHAERTRGLVAAAGGHGHAV